MKIPVKICKQTWENDEKTWETHGKDRNRCYLWVCLNMDAVSEATGSFGGKTRGT